MTISYDIPPFITMGSYLHNNGPASIAPFSANMLAHTAYFDTMDNRLTLQSRKDGCRGQLSLR